MAITKFSARVAKIKYIASALTFDASTALDAESGTTIVSSVKNITVTPPNGETELMPLLGESTQTIGSGGVPATNTSQNAFLDEKNFGVATVTGTLVLRGDEDFESMIVGGGVATVSATRYTFGDSASSKKRILDGAIIIDLDNGSEIVTFAFGNPIMNMGELKPTGPDGHFEVDFEATCLPENFAFEYKD